MAAFVEVMEEGPSSSYIIPPSLPPPLRTACLSELPAENFGTQAAGIWTFSVGRGAAS